MDALSVEILRYAYDAGGQLTNRWSKEKGNTAYTYDDVGNLTGVNYPASTDLSFDYDAVNRLTNMVDAAGTTKFTYTGFGALESEDGPWADDTVTYGYNTARMLSSVSVARPHSSVWTQSYGYDDSKRLDTIDNPLGTFDYAYNTTQRALFNKVTFPSGLYVTNKFDSLARLEETWLKNSANTALNKHVYVYNDGNQRTKQTLIDGNYLDYSYDDVGQLIAATGKESGGTTRLHEKFGYGYDAANNLNTRTNNALVQTFNVNDVNELTSISRSGTLTVSGTSGAAASSVTVNGSAATLYTDNTFAKSGLSISAGDNTFTAIASDSYGRSSTNSITVNLPSSVTPAYDDNGNLTNDDNRDFVYDDENQLVEVRVSGDWKTTFTYDGRGRLRIRKEYDWTGSSWDLASETRYVYDGMLVLQERNADNLPAVTYTRGLDLSGTLQGAGGIGGLLARTDHQNGVIPTVYYHSDGNGNVTALVNDAEAVVGRYHYDPFGGLIAASGPAALDNKYRFSSKEFHVNSGLYYYGYRFYDPNLQRWITSDPIDEPGFSLIRFLSARVQAGAPWKPIKWHILNRGEHSYKPQYTFVFNQPGNEIDPLGLDCPGCDGLPAQFESPCALECCAEHDYCYDQHDCSAWSWICSTWTLIPNDCQRCNAEVVGCLLGCARYDEGFDDPATPNYYCAVHHVFFDDPNSPHMHDCTN